MDNCPASVTCTTPTNPTTGRETLLPPFTDRLGRKGMVQVDTLNGSVRWVEGGEIVLYAFCFGVDFTLTCSQTLQTRAVELILNCGP